MTDYHAYLVVLVAIALDFASGVAKGAMGGNLDSKVMRDGLYHKFAYVLALAAASLIEYGETVLDLGYAVPIVLPACAYIVVTETVSIIENVAAMNPDLSNSPLLKLFDSDKNRKE